MVFFNQYDRRPVTKGEENDGEILVEKAGFVPVKKRIEDLMLAGQRLQEVRSEQHDFPDGIDDGRDVDPIRNIGLDLAEASAIQNDVKAKLKKSAELAKAAAEAAEAASKSAKADDK